MKKNQTDAIRSRVTLKNLKEMILFKREKKYRNRKNFNSTSK